MKKYDMISALSEETAKEVVRNEESWRGYLNTASRLYKYPFKDQLLIYAQRPDAKACASIEVWNEKMHCWVNKGAKGIALIDDENHKKLRYVFDISDVHKARRIGRFPQLWEMGEEHKEAVLSHLEKIYGYTDKEAGFAGRIRQIADQITEDCYKEIVTDMKYLKESSFLEELDGLNMEMRIKETLADSIAYTVLKRCGMEENELAEEISFPYIHEFNTVETLSQIGTNISDLAKPILMEIGKAIGAYEKEADRNLSEKGLANTSQTRYNALKRESEEQEELSITQTGNAGERSKNDEFSIREERGLSDTDVTDRRAARGNTDEIRADEEELSEGTQERSIYRASSERETDRTPVDDTGAGRAENGTADRADERERGSDRAAQSRKPDVMGTEDEQHQTFSGGNRTDGTDIQLNIQEPEGTYGQLSLFPSFEEQVGNIAAAEASIKYTMPAAFSLPQEQVDIILRSGGGRNNSRKRIYAKYQQGKTPEEMAEFLKNEYETTGKGFDFGDNPVSLWFDENGMQAGYGTSAKEAPLAVMSWQEVESHIRSMVENGTYMSANEVFLVESVERERVANDIQNFFRDGIGEMPESLKLKAYNYPESISHLCELLSTLEGREQIAEEIEKAKAGLDSGEKQIKWNYVKTPEYLLEQIEDLSAEKKEYPANDTVEVRQEDFITQDEIDARLTGGSGFEYGKFRIYDYFRENHTKKENIEFLKKEYGTGGSSHALPGSDKAHEDHDAKGISLEKGSYGNPYAKVLLKWNVVEKRISELIKADRYLSPKSKEAYTQYKQEQAEKAMQREQEKLEHGVRMECKKAIEREIAENFDGYRLSGDAAHNVIKEYGKERVEYILANTIMHLSHDGRFSPDNKEWAKDMVSHADWNTRDLIVTSHPAVLDGFTNQTRRYQELEKEPEVEKEPEAEKQVSPDKGERTAREQILSNKDTDTALGEDTPKPEEENGKLSIEKLQDRMAEMSAVVKICKALERSETVGWNEDTQAVTLSDDNRTLEGKEAFDLLFTEAADYVVMQSINGNMGKAIEMDSLLAEAKKYVARYDTEKQPEKIQKEKPGEEQNRYSVMETSDAFEQPFAVWDNEREDYYITEDGTIPTFETAEEASEYSNRIKETSQERETKDFLSEETIQKLENKAEIEEEKTETKKEAEESEEKQEDMVSGEFVEETAPDSNPFLQQVEKIQKYHNIQKMTIEPLRLTKQVQSTSELFQMMKKQ